MKKWLLYAAWLMMFVICAGLGFIPEPKGSLYACLFIFALIFFIPPIILTCQAIRNRDIPELKRIRAISLTWLVLTLIILAVNFLSVGFTEAAGKYVYWLLIIVSSPMVCGQVWVVSIFLWGCLLSASWQEIFKHRKRK